MASGSSRHRNDTVLECPQCRITFATADTRRRYCSITCSDLARRVPQVEAVCVECGATYLRRSKQKLYCTSACLKKSEERRRVPVYMTAIIQAERGRRLSTGAIGALGELRACADLIERGYFVFRAVSPASPCDLIALSPSGLLLRIEVRCGARRVNGAKTYVPVSEHRRPLVDAVAVVFRDEIEYVPELPELPGAPGKEDQCDM